VGLSDEAKLKLDEMALHGGADVSGKAHYADNPDQLNTSLENIFSNIIDHSYSYTSPSVPSVRMVDKDVLYISSFIPDEKSPFWMGTLKAYQLNSDGTLPVDTMGNPLNSPLWDAGVGLKGVSPGSRTIYTYARGAMRDFASANITKEDLGVATDAERNAVINYVRGDVQDTYDLDDDLNTTEQRPWKMGDIFHSNTVIVGSPSPYYKDEGFDGTGGFYETNKNRTKLVIVGANDGMLHAFNATTGVEEWDFIPNSLLTNLKAMMTTHNYYVDSTPKVSDVWFYSSDSDTTKGADEWKTILVCGLRKGEKHYFALDITNTLNPQYLWEFPHPGDPKISNYTDFLNNTLGQSWSEPAIGKVRVKQGSVSLERWVAFIGGGFDPSERVGNDANVGKAFFVVDIKTGEIMKEFSGLSGMTHCFAAPPTAVDINFDGYIDKVYIGDLGGQMWFFDVSSDKVTDWTGQILFRPPAQPSEKHMIYYQPAVAFDKNRIAWVYFGTGNREDPNEYANPSERFYAVKDDGSGNYPRTEGDLANVTPDAQNTFDVDPNKKGWYIQLYKGDQTLEKVLAKPTLFNQLVYFTTYKNKDTDDPCSGAGVSSLYTVEYLSGGGALAVDDFSDLSGTAGARSKEIGIGAPSTPVISVSVKAQGSVIIGTTSGQIYSQQTFSPSSGKVLLYWREVVP
jgi:type IV pilus assembly protein PilY1